MKNKAMTTDLKSYWYRRDDLQPVKKLVTKLELARSQGKRLVTTNGCFDLLHAGHVCFLNQARALGDVLVVGLNSDTSVRRLKGSEHPIISESDRAAMLTALRPVDHVVVFDDMLPNDLLALLQPDIHCKAADYAPDALPEAVVVRHYGGAVRILPLVVGYSTSKIIERVIAITQATTGREASYPHDDDERLFVIHQLLNGANALRQTAYRLGDQIVLAATTIGGALSEGRKVLLCGNGSSAAYAQHISAELVERFRGKRDTLPAIALTTDTSVFDALGNDYGFEEIFARQVSALGQAGDVLVVISTSGTSRNVLAAAKTARLQGLHVIGLTGERPSPLAEAVHLCLAIPSQDTAYIQQTHIAILHSMCDLVERMLIEEEGNDQSSGRISRS